MQNLVSPTVVLVSPLVALVVGLLVAGANYAVQRWRYRVDRLAVAADHLCSEINAAADLSTDYWLLDAGLAENYRETHSIEPKLIGRQIRLQSLRIALQSLDKKVDLKSSESLLVSLFDEMTGGFFKSPNRAADPDRAQRVQAIAAELNGTIRNSVGERSHLIT